MRLQVAVLRFRSIQLVTTGHLITTGLILIFAVSGSPAQGSQGQSPQNPRSSGPILHNIRGKVYLPAGNLPDQRMRVVLELTTGGTAAETFSDSVGNFEFRSIPSNTYRVVVPTDNQSYDTTQETVELFGNLSRTFTVQIFLKDKDSDVKFKTTDRRLIGAADHQEIPKNARKSYEKAVKLAQKNKPEEAIKLLHEALAAFPDYLYAINKLGEQHMAMKKMAEAQAAFERAIAVNTKYAAPHINLGLIHMGRHQFREAIAEFETGNSLDDSFPMCHLNLGLALMSVDPPDYDRAEKEITRAIQMGGKVFVSAYKHLFNLNIRRQDLPKAAQNLEAYLKDAGDAPDAADIRKMLDRVKQAIAQKGAGQK